MVWLLLLIEFLLIKHSGFDQFIDVLEQSWDLWIHFTLIASAIEGSKLHARYYLVIVLFQIC